MAQLTRLSTRTSPISPVDSPRSLEALTTGFTDKTRDRRHERQSEGVVKWRASAEPNGELIAHTREGHLVKDADFYASLPQQNRWNDPRKAGPFTWRMYHGPKHEMQGELMEIMDRRDEKQERWARKSGFVKAYRHTGQARSRARHVEHVQPKEVFKRSEAEKWSKNAWEDLKSLPPEAVPKVITPRVIRGDKEAMKAAASSVHRRQQIEQIRLQQQEYFRSEVLINFQKQRDMIDELEERSGQPPRMNLGEFTAFDGSPRVASIAEPSPRFHPKDWLRYPDFRGLLHADMKDVLETCVSPERAPVKASTKLSPETSVVPAQLTPRVASVTYTRELPAPVRPPPTPPPRIPKNAPGGQASHDLGFRCADEGMQEINDDVSRFEDGMKGLGNLGFMNFFAPAAKQNTYREPAPRSSPEEYRALDGVSHRLDAHLIDAMTPRRNSFITSGKG